MKEMVLAAEDWWFWSESRDEWRGPYLTKQEAVEAMHFYEGIGFDL